MIYFAIILGITAIYILLKNDNTYKNHGVIMEAIFRHNLDHLHDYDEYGYLAVLSYDSMESYWKTLFRFWDWGYKNIVDKGTFEKIEPYIKRG